MQVKLVSLSPYSLRLQEIATTAAGRRIKRLFKVGAWGRLLCFSPSHSSPGVPPELSSGARPKCYTICYHLQGVGGGGGEGAGGCGHALAAFLNTL